MIIFQDELAGSELLRGFDIVKLSRGAKGYSAQAFEKRETFRGDYRIVAEALLDCLPFNTVLDVGCANGFLIESFLDAGKTARGIEVSPAVVEILPPELLEAIEIGDFAAATGSWDLVCCVEVAEHIPPERSRELVKKLTGLATSWIYFTAAPVGQSGRGHINCRSHLEWLDWFALEGWALSSRSHHLRQRLMQLERARWLVGNGAVLAPFQGEKNESMPREVESDE